MDIVDNIKREFNYQINNFNINKIYEIINILKNTPGNIYCCGVGKSGNIAKHCCDLLKCISYKSFYLNILNTTHGDIGTLNNKDVILIFSNSGNTIEIINIIPLFKNIGVFSIGVCCNKKSKFKELCDLTIVTPFQNEIEGEINKIPTNSIMSHLLFINILISISKNRITLDKYKQNHLSGNIGKSLLKIKDVLSNNFPKIIISRDNMIDINIILLKMTEYKCGCCFFINNDDELLGILTDGDIRRLLIGNNNVKININNINSNFYYEKDLEKYVALLKYNYTPILSNKKLIGIVSKIKSN